MSLAPGRPGSKAVAVEQHRSGHAAAWGPCPGCKADDGELCWSLRPLSYRQVALGLPRQHKATPCAGRPYLVRLARDIEQHAAARAGLIRSGVMPPEGDS